MINNKFLKLLFFDPEKAVFSINLGCWSNQKNLFELFKNIFESCYKHFKYAVIWNRYDFNLVFYN